MVHLFRCSKCKLEFEKYLRPGQAIAATCPKCSAKAKKVFGISGIKIGETWPQVGGADGDNPQAEEGVIFENRYQEDKYFDKLMQDAAEGRV